MYYYDWTSGKTTNPALKNAWQVTDAQVFFDGDLLDEREYEILRLLEGECGFIEYHLKDAGGDHVINVDRERHETAILRGSVKLGRVEYSVAEELKQDNE